jgi:hypothetical protein
MNEVCQFELTQISEFEYKSVVSDFKERIQNEPILLDIQGPIVVVGDLHGQLPDLYRIIQQCGSPPLTRYLFLGDLVDRGNFQLKSLLLFFY